MSLQWLSKINSLPSSFTTFRNTARSPDFVIVFVINQLAFFIAAAAGYRRYGAETTEEIILKPLNPLSCRISYNKKRTRIARIARMEISCIREIRVIRVRCKNQLVLCFVGTVLALLVHCMLCWCSSCLVGALLALASGKAERRQVHPLETPP